MTVTTQPRRCYVCGAELKKEDVPMQDAYRGKLSRRLYVPATVQTWCPRGHKVAVRIVMREDLGV